MKLKNSIIDSRYLKIFAIIILMILVMNSKPLITKSTIVESKVTAFKYEIETTTEDAIVYLYFKGRITDKFNKNPYFEGTVSIDNQVFKLCSFECIEDTDLFVTSNGQKKVIANISTDSTLNEVVIEKWNENYFAYSKATIIAGPAIRKEDATQIYN